jgi:hypothetical protein
MTTTLKKYIRDEKRNPKGVVVLVKDGERFYFGYSLCSPRDKFSKKLGTTIALARATSPLLETDEAMCPLVANRREEVASHYQMLEKQALKYFKA